MKRLVILVGALALALVAALVVAALLLDAESFRAPITQYASTSLGREVTLGKLDITFWPMPAVRAHELRIAGHEPQAPPLAEIEEVRLRLAVLPLLARRVVLRAVEVDAPHIVIPFDAHGRPILPELSAPSQEPQPSGGPDAAPQEPAAERAGGAVEPLLAIDRIRVRDARLQAGPYRLDGAQLDGAFTLGGAAKLDFQIADTAYKEGDVALSGPVSGSLELGREFVVLLDDATLVSGSSFRKPAGERLRVRGKLGNELSLASLGEVTVQLGANEIPLELALAKQRPEILVRATNLDLASVHKFLSPDVPELGGRVQVEQMQVMLSPLSIVGKARLEGVSARLEHGPVRVTGPLVARGSVLALEQAEATAGDAKLALSGSYDLDRGSAALDFGTENSDIEKLIGFLTGSSSKLAGMLGASGNFRTSGGLEGLSGSGRFAITPGSLRGFSLVKEVLGPLSQVGLAVAQFKGKDLSRYEREDFERLAADFRIDRGVLRTENLVLAYKDAVAQLRGSVSLVDQSLDLTGEMTLGEALNSELAGGSGTRRKVIPLGRIRGTVDSPRLELDLQTLARIAAAFGAEDKLRTRIDEQLEGAVGERLEKQLGAGSKDAVKGILDGLLGGHGSIKSQEPAETQPTPTAEPTSTPEPVAEPPAADTAPAPEEPEDP